MTHGFTGFDSDKLFGKSDYDQGILFDPIVFDF